MAASCEACTNRAVQCLVRILILGRRTRLGSYIRDAADAQGHEVIVPDVDVTSTDDLLSKAIPCDVVINCAASTDVTFAERHHDKAMLVNTQGAAHAALFARTLGATFIHISSDYVFNGQAGPYHSLDRPYPIQVYGWSKYMGEIAVRSIMANHPHSIVRLGWLYGMRYPESAPMVAYSKPMTYLWNDIFGTPTHAGEAATSIVYMLHEKEWRWPEIVQVSPEMEPVSWYDFVRQEIPRVEWVGVPKIPQRPVKGGLVPTPSLSQLSTDLSPLWRELEQEKGGAERSGQV